MAKAPEDDQSEDDRSDDPSWRAVAREGANLAFAIGCIVALWVFLRWGDPPPPVKTKQFVEVTQAALDAGDDCGPARADGKPTVVTMLYSEDKEKWIEHAATLFARRCPSIQIKLTSMGSMSSVAAILAAESPEELPVLWSPTDDLVVKYLEARWGQRSGPALMRPQEWTSLLRSPLVFLLWDDRRAVLDAILKADRGEEWMKAGCPLIPREAASASAIPGRGVRGRWIDWYNKVGQPGVQRKVKATKKDAEKAPVDEGTPPPTPEEITRWGEVKIMHAMPTRAGSGLAALYLQAYDYALPAAERGSAPAAGAPVVKGEGGTVTRRDDLREALRGKLDAKKDALRGWLRRCEAGFEEVPESTEELTESLFQVGPSRYDGVMTYEHFVFPILASINGHEGDLKPVRVIYPETNLVSEHPVLYLWPDDPAREGQREAASKWIAFLQSKAMQQQAIEYGFRPSAAVTIEEYDVEANPFLHLRRYGIELEPALVEPPLVDGASLHTLVEVWKEATGRN